MYYLDRTKLHKDILIKLKVLNRPQNYLKKKINLSRSTLWRLQDENHSIDINTLFRIINWLESEPVKYIKLK